MPDIDSLSIQISSDASQAERAIDNLVLKLGSLKNGLENLSKIRFGNTFSTAATGISRIADAANRIDADALNRISDSLVRLSGIDLSGIGGADQFKALSSGLAQLGKVKIGTAAQQLPTIVTALRDLSGVQVPAHDIAELGKALGKLGSSNAQKAVTNMPQLANAFKQLVADLSNLPSINNNVVQLAQAFATLAQHGNQVGNIMRFTSGTFGGIGTGAIRATSGVNILKKSMDSMHNSINGILGKITRLTAGFLSIRSVFNVLKDSVEVASAITEVQNVVDKTFGETRVKLEDFAKTAVSSYGMSELTAKKIASQFQAMGATVGLTTKQVGDAHEFLSDRIHEAYQVENASMADMSVNLTRLTSDMASFYDVSQEDVATKLQAIFTGASRPLRQFGIDLTQATLQEWALKHGIDAEVKSMSQAEKVMLRYMYVMDRTAVAQGDFADTIGSWHNQMTLLTEGFKQLKAIVGQGLINMFRPFLMSLNSAMNTAIDLVQKAFNAMGKLLGWQIEIEDVQGSLGYVGSDFDSEDEDLGEADVSEADKAADDVADTTEELADAADSAGDVGDGMNDAADGAKELKRQIMSFDELHTLADNSEDVAKAMKDAQNAVPKTKSNKDKDKDKDKDEDKGGDDEGNAYPGGGEEGEITGGKVTFKPYESPIDSWWDFGKAITDKLADGMESVDWDAVKGKAIGFATRLANFLNGMIDNTRFFEDLGSTIANSLNTALQFASTWLRSMHWGTLGQNIGNMINRGVEDFDWSLLGRTIADGFNAAVAFWKNLGETIDFYEIGMGVAASINKFFSTFKFSELAETLNTWVDNLWDFILGVLKGIDWDTVIEQGITFAKTLDIDTITFAIGTFAWTHGGAAVTMAMLKKLFFKALFASGQAILNIPKLILNVQGFGFALAGTAGFEGALLVFGNSVIDGITGFLQDHLPEEFYKTLNNTLGGALTGLAAGVAVGSLATPIGAVAGGIMGALLGALVGKVTEGFENPGALWDAFKEGLQSLFSFERTKELWEQVKEDFNKGGEYIVEGVLIGLLLPFDAFMEIQAVFDKIWQAFIRIFGITSSAESMYPLGEKIFLGVVDGFKSKFDEFDAAVRDWYDNKVKPWFTKEKWEELGNNVYEGLKTKWEEFSKWWENTGFKDWWDNKVKPWFTQAKWEITTDGMKSGIKTKWTSFTNWWNTTGFKNWWDQNVMPNFTRAKWEELGGNMESALTSKWSAITQWWDTNVVSVFRNSIAEIQSLFSGIDFSLPQITLPHWTVTWDDLGIISLPNIGVDWYEKGGYIEDGLFTMNQGEIAGKFSNGTSVVANNQMITDSISSAVERAIVQQLPGIIESAVSRADTGGDVYIGDEQIYMASKRGEARANKRYSPSIAY